MQQQHGSGKTAVLVERIINKAINENIDIDKLLVVTFTNAAASEMRERVLDAIYKKLDKEPENKNLQKQITLLNMANICTIDSFCLDVVKNNFYELENISPNFRIADTPEVELLKQEILDELFEQKYLSEDKDFTTLINTYTGYRDDTPLKDLILTIYNYINSSPYPLKWLDEKIELFNLKDKLNNNFSETIWGKSLIKEVDDEITDDIAILEDTRKSLENDIELEPFKQIFESDIKQLQVLKQNLNNWDKAYEISQNFNFTTWSRKKVESEIKDEAKVIRDSVKKKFQNKIEKIFVSDSKQSNQDIYDMYSILKKLENLIIEFDEIFSNKKRDKNIVDFTDIEHLALNILVKGIDKNGNIIKSDVAKKYTEKFEEIEIDEYQDSNLVQEYILSSVSNGNNMFMVGDVKQSIYRFRQAMPKLFLEKYENFGNVKEYFDEDFIDNRNPESTKTNANNVEQKYNTQENLKGRKIQLFKNFRSRKNILEFTNLVFKNIMSNELGEIDYNQNEYLNFGAEYYTKGENPKTEIDIINIKKEELYIEKLETDSNLSSNNTDLNENKNYTNVNENKYDTSFIENTNYDDIEADEDSEKDELEHIENIELEAKYVAKKIQNLIKSKYQVFDKEQKKLRDIKYKDIAILLRTTKEKANVYERELIKLGIPVFSDSNQEYLDSIEIQTIMSLLKIIDNPMQDIPLVTVLRSNIGKFTDNELVEIRLSDKYDNFYVCMQKAKHNVNEKLSKKIEKFLNNIEEWRKEQEYLALDELIWKIYSDTGYYNYVGLMPNGNVRQANLKMLFERAKKYETASFKGLYNFINFIDKLKLNSGDLGSAKIIGENDDVVRIMSIHKSKGLEFPVVILANANKQFNDQDIRKNPVLLHQEMGIGAKYIDYDLQIQYPTLTREAIKNVILNENISEEMRVLYVALTRAKEKLIITGISKDFEKEIEDIEKNSKIYQKKNGKINPILVKKYKSFLDWLLLVYEYEKTNDMFEINNIEAKDVLNKSDEEIETGSIEKITNILDSEEINENEIDKIKGIVEYKYPNALETTLPTKSSITKIKQMKQNQIEVDIESLESVFEEKKTQDTELKNNKQEKIVFEKPKFLQDEKSIKITPSQKGTAIHLCMSKLNVKENYDLQKIKDFISDLEINKFLSTKEAELIDPNQILNFTKSKIWIDLKQAQEVYKEKPFYINIPAKEIYENENLKSNILVQGIIDLYYVDKYGKIILLDYKTDYIQAGDEEKLIKRYKIQLDLYKRALEQALGKKVEKTYIYSVCLGKEIEV